ncbi:MAG: extracellular solute-binding protein [Clostridia bacterium]|nr:extracellular solute-binding protein [Clostridia bacterium]
MKAWIAAGLSLCLLASCVLPVGAAPATEEYDYVLLGETSPEVGAEVTVPADGLYQIEVLWRSVADQATDYVVNVSCNSGEAYQAALPRMWENVGDIYIDRLGNEFAPAQEERIGWQNTVLYEEGGAYTKPLLFELTAGTNAVDLSYFSGEVQVARISATLYEEPVTYDEYRGQHAAGNYTGAEIVLEGEDADYKSDNFIIPLSDNNSALIQPNSPKAGLLNYIGGTNWKYLGATVTWKVEVPESAWYKLNFNYRQNFSTGSVSFRKLTVDGQVPAEEFSKIAFPYGTNWEYYSPTDAEGNDLLLYLEEGERELALTISMGDMDEFSEKLSAVVYDLSEIYRDIRGITGESPDANRDYDLFRHIPNLEERVTAAYDQVLALSEEAERLTGSAGGGGSASLRKVAVVIEKILEAKWKAHRRLSSFNDAVSSLSAWLYELQEMPLDIDAILLSAPEGELERPKESGFFTRLAFKVNRIVTSFFTDYSMVSGAEGNKSIDLWANWGNDQIKVLSVLTESDFTAKTGINVNIRITSANLIQAKLSGRAPDVVLAVSRTAPVNYSMRGALLPLSDFPDFDEVCERFADMATVPYTYNGKVYGLPNSQSFFMLFYRTDIFEQYGLTVPQTWEEFKTVSDILRLRGMETGMPYSPISNMWQTDSGVGALSLFPTLAVQKGAQLYNDDLTGVNFTDGEVVDAFEEMMNYYSEREFPVSYDFFNRFRSGVMPMAIQGYGTYATIAAAAPEIRGKWQMVSIPGTLQEDGTINRQNVGSGDASVILSSTKNPKEAWEYIKWWSSEDTQYQYTRRVESAAGAAARHNSANIGATLRLDWNEGIAEQLETQWGNLVELPELPGGYYVSRAVDQIYWNVVNKSSSIDYLMSQWNDVVNNEIRRKTEEYANN